MVVELSVAPCESEKLRGSPNSYSEEVAIVFGRNAGRQAGRVGSSPLQECTAAFVLSSLESRLGRSLHPPFAVNLVKNILIN